MRSIPQEVKLRTFVDHSNKDLEPFESYEEARDRILHCGKSYGLSYPFPIISTHDGIRVVRDDIIVGTKARAAAMILQGCEQKTVVYCQPRVGLAGVSLIDAAEKHDKDVVLFMPACHEISDHQACCIERGAKPIFKRIAAMPNLALAARRWAQDDGAYFIPLGLRHSLATKALVYTASLIPEPQHVWCAISTGVLCRALQIAWPNAKVHAVSVARNLQEGELGRAEFIAEPAAFQTKERPENLPPFPSVDTYDGKVYKYIPKNSGEDHLFWNVGADPVLKNKDLAKTIDSWRDW